MLHPFSVRARRAADRSARRPVRRRLLVPAALVAALLAPLVVAAPAQAQGASVFVFHGAGWGHGVGMSQNGARNMADQGYDHVGILSQYYPNTVILPTAPLDHIRVHIGDASRVEFTSAGSLTFEKAGTVLNSVGSGTVLVTAHDGGLQIGSVWTPVSVAGPVTLSFPQAVTISNNGHRYLWGKIQLTNRDGKVRVVEQLSLEDYVAGISEMPAAWPLEALMAQAIAARTYAHEVTLHRRASSEWAQEYDISGSTVDQNYIGWDAQDGPWDQKWLAAVKATAGVEIVDNGGPVRAYYSASNGGWTETAAYVFGNDVSHTVAGPDPFDAGGHNWSEWTRTYSQSAMSRWLSRSTDTNVGTLQAINLLGGAGASGRIDQAAVELVGSAGTKRVTGRRLMVVMNSGIFGEGLGLDDHLPGTFTTIGNGASAGFPESSGQPGAPTITPDPAPEAGDDDAGFTPPPGWSPEPGTGVEPLRLDDGSAAEADADAATDTSEDADSSSEDAGTPSEDAGTPSEDAGTPSEDAGTPSEDADTDDTGFTPPPGWTPEPGTGVPPVASESTPDTPSSDDAATEEPATAAPSEESNDSFVPPADWSPEPGTGVEPLRLEDGSASDAGDTGDTASHSDDGIDYPENAWRPDTGLGGGDSSIFIPPAGWTPEPGTGVPPINPSRQGLASSVLLVTRVQDSPSEPAQFRVIAPDDALADEAEVRLGRLQTQAALALFADFDIEGYVDAVAPRPVHGVCTATDEGITCVSLAALQAAND